MKVLSLFLGIVLAVGCRNIPSRPDQERIDTESAHVDDGSIQVRVQYETQVETLDRTGREVEADKHVVNGPPVKEWYGKRLGGLGLVRIVTVPHKSIGARNRDRDVTKKHILAALAHYRLVDYEDFRSSTHIPMGASVRIEYRNGISGWVNFFGGVPYTATLTRNNSRAKYGLRRIFEQPAPADAKNRAAKP